MASHILLLLLFVTSSIAFAVATQKDFCVADLTQPVGGDGFYPCKDPNLVQVNDFLFSGLQIPPSVNTSYKGGFTPVFDHQLPGLNRLGISFFRFDFDVGGFVPPHTHPRGTEIWTVIEGTVQVWFDTAGHDKRRFTKVANKGDVFVVPIGLVHWLKNAGKTRAIVIGSFSNQNPGVVLVKR